MATFLPPTAIGVLGFLLGTVNTLFWCTPLFAVTLAKLILPIPAWRRLCSRVLMAIAENWISCNNWWIHGLHRPRWRIEGAEFLRRDSWYLAIANHQSWADVCLLQAASNRRMPMLKFIIKDQLRWVPVLGLAWWAMDMPFVKRYSKKQLDAHPQLRGRDLAATRKSCEKYRLSPVSVFSFIEGTRFTSAKHSAQSSPYHNLLKPRPGGIAIIINAMPMIQHLVDFTLVYHSDCRSFWDFLCGRMNDVRVQIRRVDIPRHFSNENYLSDAAGRGEFRTWLQGIWRDKDALITSMKTPLGEDQPRDQSRAQPRNPASTLGANSASGE